MHDMGLWVAVTVVVTVYLIRVTWLTIEFRKERDKDMTEIDVRVNDGEDKITLKVGDCYRRAMTGELVMLSTMTINSEKVWMVIRLNDGDMMLYMVDGDGLESLLDAHYQKVSSVEIDYKL